MTSPDETPQASNLMEVEEKPIVVGPEPVEPVKTRRSLIAHLDTIHPEVAKIVKLKARKCVTEMRRYSVTKEDVRNTKLKDKAEKLRVCHREMFKQVNNSKEERQRFKRLREQPLPVSSGDDAPNFTNTKKAIDQHIRPDKSKFVKPYGQQKGFLNTTADTVEALKPVIKLGNQTEQLLGRISELFMKKCKDMEYETMVANGRLFFSSNHIASVDAIAKLYLQDLLNEAAGTLVADNSKNALLKQYKIGIIAQALAASDPNVPLTPTQQKGAEYLAEYEVGYHIEHDARQNLVETLKVLQKQIRTKVKIHGPLSIADAAKALNDATLEGSVIAVMPPDDKSHAEQYLALTLIKAGYRKPSVIGGTKNPCSCCWLALSLTLRHNYQVKFNNFAGLYWPKAARGVALVAQALGVEDISDLVQEFKDTNKLTNDSDIFMQHVTALKEHALTVVVKKGGGLKDDGFTQNTTALSTDMVDNPPFSDDALPKEYAVYPGSPVQTYGTPINDVEYMQEVEDDRQFTEKHTAWEKESEKAAAQKKKIEEKQKKEKNKNDS